MTSREHTIEVDEEAEAPEVLSYFTPHEQPIWAEDCAFELTRVLATAQEGASTIAECLLAVGRIEGASSTSWYSTWIDLAARTKRRADAAFRSGSLAMAADNWLRASNYYRTAGVFLRESDERQDEVIEKMRLCSHLYLAHGSPAASVINVPFSNRLLEAYFIPARTAGCQSAVICVGEMGSFKEDLLFSMRRHGIANGISLLLIDPPDRDQPLEGGDSASSVPITGYISRWADYLFARGDVDPNRVAIYGDGLGGSYATTALKADHRFAAAVCDGGLWEAKEWSFVAQGTLGVDAVPGAPFIGDPSSSLPPMLTLIGDKDYVSVRDVEEIWALNVAAGIDHDLKIFTVNETGAGPSQIDNPTIAKEFAFGWLRQKLRVRQHGSTESDEMDV